MITFLLLQVAAVQPATPAAMQTMAAAGKVDALFEAARSDPDSARDAVRLLFGTAVAHPDSAPVAIANSSTKTPPSAPTRQP